MVRPLAKLTMAFNRPDGAIDAVPGKAPDEFNNLDIWWDPDDDDEVTLTGSTIDQITNKGDGGACTLIGPGSNTAGAVEATRSLADGVNWASFDTATKQILRVQGTNTVWRRGTSNFTVVAVFRSTQSSGFTTFFNHALVSGTTAGFGIYAPHTVASYTNRFIMRDSTAQNAIADSVVSGLYDGNTHTIVGVRNNSAGANGESYLYLDAVKKATTSLPSFFGTVDDTAGGAWRDPMIGGRGAGGTTTYQNFSSHLAGDVVIYGQAFSDQDVIDLHDWLMNKWGGS